MENYCFDYAINKAVILYVFYVRDYNLAHSVKQYLYELTQLDNKLCCNKKNREE